MAPPPAAPPERRPGWVNGLQPPRGLAVRLSVVGSSSARIIETERVYSDEHHSVAVCGSVILSYSMQPPNPRYLSAWDEATARLAARTVGSLAVVTIIDSRSPPPDDPSSKAIRLTITKHKDRISALAYVVEGRGFGAAAMRGVLSLISLAARYPFPQKVFMTIEEAAPWVVRVSAHGTTASSIIATAGRMRGEVRLATAG